MHVSAGDHETRRIVSLRLSIVADCEPSDMSGGNQTWVMWDSHLYAVDKID